MGAQIHPIINSADVKHMMADQNVVIIDARGGPDAFERFEASHLESAVFLDLDRDLSQKPFDPAVGGRHPLPAPKTFGSMLGRCGITPESHVLVYDDKAGANAAARFWWMMKAAGHAKVQVIDGGLQGLVKSGALISSGPGFAPKSARPYPVTAWERPVADIQDVDRWREDSNHVLIDVRESYRYRGESEPIDLIAGHIPGAVNYPYPENLEPDGTFRSAKALADQYGALTAGRHGEQVVVHCGSGVTACHTLLALEIAGITGASLYVGSWSEWSRNQKPLAKGEKP